MYWKFLQCSNGIFKVEFRRQLLVTLSVTLITFCHGIGLGWFSPMLPKLQSPTQSPLDFVIDVGQASWLGAFVSVGGFCGNFLFAFVMGRFGRKAALFCLAVPHMCIWVFLYFAQSIEWLFIARVCGGLTGGGIYIVMPIFIGEISDNSIRGRLCSIFPLTMNTGVLTGFILSSHLPYHMIPCVVIAIPLLYVMLAFRYPETPQQLLRWGRLIDSENSMKFYRNFRGDTKEEKLEFQQKFNELTQAIKDQKSLDHTKGVNLKDFCDKNALKSLLTGLLLMLLNIFSGTFAFINYMSNIFTVVKTELDPNTNTIIIGAVQIFGTVVSIYLVDRYGRKILLIISSAGMTIGLAAFGLYAFFAEETTLDLTSFNWLPLLLMALVIFVANIGIIPVSLVVLVEILPPKIRTAATSLCLASLSILAFASLKSFPILMNVLGLSGTMWFCATVSALGLFYISVFLVETKGKSLN